MSKKGISLMNRSSAFQCSEAKSVLLYREKFTRLNSVSTRGFWFGPKRVPACDLSKQSIIQEDGARKLALIGNGPLLKNMYDDCRTTIDAFHHGMRAGGKEMMGSRELEGDKLVWKWITYEEAFERANNIGQSMRKLGIPTGDDTRIGIFSRNRPEWILVDMASTLFSNASVALYDNIGLDDTVYIANLSELAIVFTDTKIKTKSLLENTEKLPHLKYLVQFDKVDEKIEKLAKEKNIKLWSQEEFEKMGANISKDEQKPHVLPTPETIVTVSFTSGTTGRPKGVIVTHQNVCSSFLCARDLHIPKPPFSYLSYLPLPHMFERMVIYLNFLHGAKVGFFRGEPQHILEDIQSINPTTIAAVPRVIDKIHKGVLRQLQGNPVKEFLFNAAMAYKEYVYQKTGFATKDTWADKYILAKVQGVLGTNLKQLMIGAAKADVKTLYFLRNALGADVYQGYGQTETSGPVTIQLGGDRKIGNVGPPMPCNLIKLIDVPDLGYFADKNGGEILLKGYNVTSGYLKDPEATKAAFDENGYMRTGDIGRFSEDGALEIIDRRKNVFKLPQGEFVAPEKIEGDFLAAPFVSQIYVHGEIDKPCLVAVVVPDPLNIAYYAEQKHNIKGLSYEELCKNEVLAEGICQDLIELTEKNGRPKYEAVFGVHLTSTIFTEANDMMTPTSKNKRKNIAKHFKPQIDAMFRKIEKSEKFSS